MEKINMKYQCIKFLCQKHPVKPYVLDKNICLIGGNKERTSFISGININLDSCYFVLKMENDKEKLDIISEFKKLLVIFSFIFDDVYPVAGYESDMHSKIITIEADSIDAVEKALNSGKKEAAAYPLDFDDVGKINNVHSHFSQSFSFKYFYKKFIGLNQNDLDLIYLYVFSPSKPIFSHSVYKADFLKVAMKYIIIEKILSYKKRIFCENIITECKKCERNDIQHDKVSLNKLVISELKKIIGDDDKSNKYMEFITLAKNIRNKFFHGGLTDNAKYVDDYPVGEHIEYDIQKTKNYEKDKTALMNLDVQISDISRFLLFDVLFDIKEYPELNMLKSVKIAGNNIRQASPCKVTARRGK